jgi:AraC-like DNA-binding protein
VTETSVEGVVGTPALPLRSIIRQYQGYRTVGPPALHRGLPSRNMTFIISLAAPVDIIAMPEQVDAPGALQAFVGGMHASPATIQNDGRQYGISIALSPLGARRLFGMPAGVLANEVVPLDEMLGARARTLVDRLVSAPSWREQFAVLDDMLVQQLRDGRDPPNEVVHAWDHLVATGGCIDVAQLASDVGYSRRHFGEVFRRELGLSPKVAGRVLRFERSRRLIERSQQRVNLAGVAATSGYYDHAHLTREWREIAGCAPTTWMAEELPSVQAVATELGAS